MMLMTVSIWPSSVSSANSPAPAPVPKMPPKTSTPPMRKSTPPRLRCAKMPETLAPVTWLEADAAATVGGMP